MSDHDDKSNSENDIYLSDKDDMQEIKMEEQMQQMRAAMENMQTDWCRPRQRSQKRVLRQHRRRI